MPEMKTHRRAGRVAGGVYAAHKAKDQCLVNYAVETAGGVFGGDIGSRLADVFEEHCSYASDQHMRYGIEHAEEY